MGNIFSSAASQQVQSVSTEIPDPDIWYDAKDTQDARTPVEDKIIPPEVMVDPCHLHDAALSREPSLADLDDMSKLYESFDRIVDTALSEAQLKKSAFFKQLAKLSGLKHFKLNASRKFGGARKPRWGENVKKLQELLRPIVSRERSAGEAEARTAQLLANGGAPLRLYEGSFVSTHVPNGRNLLAGPRPAWYHTSPKKEKKKPAAPLRVLAWGDKF